MLYKQKKTEKIKSYRKYKIPIHAWHMSLVACVLKVAGRSIVSGNTVTGKLGQPQLSYQKMHAALKPPAVIGCFPPLS